jgi:hypothetical protein
MRSPSRRRDRVGIEASPLGGRLAATDGRIEFVILRTGRSPPGALHPASRRRSSGRLQDQTRTSWQGLAPRRFSHFTGAPPALRAPSPEGEGLVVTLSSGHWYLHNVFLSAPGRDFLVPKLCLGMPSRTLRVPPHRGANPAAERQRRHSQAELGNEWGWPLRAKTTV